MGCSTSKPRTPDAICSFVIVEDDLYDNDYDTISDEHHGGEEGYDSDRGIFNERTFIEQQLQFFRSSSAILADRQEELELLVSFLPPTVVTSPLKRVFSASTDGWSLASLYGKVSRMKPLVILVQTVAESGHAILGVYVSECISPPHPLEVRGDGTTFVFRLDGSSRGKHCWAGMRPQQVGVSEPDEPDVQFAMCSKERLQFGSSNSGCSSALSISENLFSCSTGKCDTFASLPLLPCGDAEGVASFEARLVEVFTTQASHARAVREGGFF